MSSWVSGFLPYLVTYDEVVKTNWSPLRWTPGVWAADSYGCVLVVIVLDEEWRLVVGPIRLAQVVLPVMAA